MIVTLAQDRTAVDVERGGILEVQLPENPTTGYLWAVDSGDAAVVQLEGSEVMPNAGGGIGGAGTRVLRLRVVGSGETLLRLKRWREWEGNSSVQDRFEVTVRVSS